MPAYYHVIQPTYAAPAAFTLPFHRNEWDDDCHYGTSSYHPRDRRYAYHPQLRQLRQLAPPARCRPVVFEPAIVRFVQRPVVPLFKTRPFYAPAMKRVPIHEPTRDPRLTVAHQRLLKQRLAQEIQQRVPLRAPAVEAVGAKTLLDDDKIVYFATFDSENGWKVVKDARSPSAATAAADNAAADRTQPAAAAAATPAQGEESKKVEKKKATTTLSTPSAAATSSDEVSVEDVDEAAEDESSDIVVLDVPAESPHARSTPTFAAELEQQQPSVEEAVGLWQRELELLALLGYTNQDALLPLLVKHVGHPGRARDEVHAGLKQVVAALLAAENL